MLSIGKVASDFDVQARMFMKLCELGLTVRGEVRATINGIKTGNAKGNRVRFDLVVFHGMNSQQNPLFAIELKPKRRSKWVEYYKSTEQYRMYSLAGIPVFMVLGEKDADEFLKFVFRKILCDLDCSDIPSRVIWPEEREHIRSIA